MAKTPTINEPFTGASLPSPTPFQTSRGLSEGSFGGAAAAKLRNFGQDITQAATVGANLIVQQQDIANRSAAQDANTDYALKSVEAWNAFSQLQGRAAVDAYPAFQEQIKTLRDGILGGIENPVAREIAEPGVMSRYVSLLDGAATHNGNQTRAWRVTSAESALGVASQEALAQRDNFNAVHAGITSSVDAAIGAMAEVYGWDDVTIEAKTAEALGASYATVIGGIVTEDPIKANALFEEVRDQLDAATAASIAQKLEAPVRQARADMAVGAIVGAGTTSSEGVVQAQSTFTEYGYGDIQRAGMIGSFVTESGANMNPVIENYEGSGAFGVAQWMRPRFGNTNGTEYGTLTWFAKEKGLDYRQRSTQFAFIDWELNNTEKEAGDMLRAATTPYEATVAMLAYERPDGWKASDPEAAYDFQVRLRNTERAFGAPTPVLSDDQLRAEAYNSTEDPELRRATLTAMSEYINANNAAKGVERSAMTQRIEDLGATLVTADGWQQTIPEIEIRAAFPTVEADQYIQGLKAAQLVGQMDASIAFADPAAVSTARADLRDGTGPWSTALREALNIGVAPTEAETARLLRARNNVLADFEANVTEHANDPEMVAARKAIAAQVEDLTVTLPTAEGWQQDTTQIEADIRAQYPAEVADQVIGQIRTAKLAGEISAGTPLIDLDAQQRVREDLRSGEGPWSDKVRDAFGIGDNPTAAETAMLTRARQETLASYEGILTGRARDPETQAQVVATNATVTDMLSTLTTPDGYDQDLGPIIAQVEATFPEAQANDIIGSLKTASIVGDLNFSLPLIGREGIPDVRQDLRHGDGPWSDKIREAFGIGDNPTPAESAKLEAVRKEVLGQFDQVLVAHAEAQTRARTAFDTAVRERDQAIKDDSAGYAARSASVREALSSVVQNPTPAAWQAYATASMAVQGQLGVAPQDRHLLTDAMRTAVIGHISTLDPRGVADYLGNLEGETGSMWPQVFGELSTGTDALPTEFRVLGLIEDPGARATYVDILRAEKEMPGSTRDAVSASASEIDDSVNEALLDFNRTFTYGAGGTAVAANVTEATRLLAYRYAPTLGTDAAIAKAQSVLSGKYDVMVSEDQYIARTPAGLGDAMVMGTTYVRNSLLPQDLSAPRDLSGLYTPEELQRAALIDAQRATWVTSPKDDGWILWHDDAAGGGGSYVLDKRGEPIFVRFEDAEAYAQRYVPKEATVLLPDGTEQIVETDVLGTPMLDTPLGRIPAPEPDDPNAIDPEQFDPQTTVNPIVPPDLTPSDLQSTDILEGAPVGTPKPASVEEWLRSGGGVR